MGDLRLRSVLILALAIGLLLSGSVLAGGNGNSKKKGPDLALPAASYAGALNLSVGITANEQQIILGYIRGHKASLPPAFAGAKPLPPGIAKKLARGGSMPPGLAKRYFPADLTAQLPPRPGESWVVVGTDILLVSISTDVILDVLHDLF
jgi:hypothetical protein